MIDRKMDDGQSQTGSLIGAGTANCTAYVEGATGKDCVISYKVQN
jgi:hypothetical protein